MQTHRVQGGLRRSSRLGLTKEGYFPFRVDGEASKKRSRSGPASLPVLQGWGIGCGVAPSELTDDALM
jgi:hypothetical protein